MGGGNDSVEIELIHTLQREKVSDRVPGRSDMDMKMSLDSSTQADPPDKNKSNLQQTESKDAIMAVVCGVVWCGLRFQAPDPTQPTRPQLLHQQLPTPACTLQKKRAETREKKEIERTNPHARLHLRQLGLIHYVGCVRGDRGIWRRCVLVGVEKRGHRRIANANANEMRIPMLTISTMLMC